MKFFKRIFRGCQHKWIVIDMWSGNDNDGYYYHILKSCSICGRQTKLFESTIFCQKSGCIRDMVSHVQKILKQNPGYEKL